MGVLAVKYDGNVTSHSGAVIPQIGGQASKLYHNKIKQKLPPSAALEFPHGVQS